MANKITKRENFTTIMTVLKELGKDDLVQVMAHEIELLDKKSSSKTATKTQIENEDIKSTLINVLENAGSPMTVTEIMKSSEEMGAYSNQKISALLRQLVECGKVAKTTDKKKSYFEVVTE